MLDFIHLQLKLKWGFNRNNNKKNAIMTAVASLLAVAIALALVYGLSYVLKSSIDVTARKLSVMFLTVLMIGLTVAATGMQMNRLYNPSDLHITARFPLSPFKIFLSYLIINYIDLLIYSAILLLPIMLVFGWAMHCITFVYVLGVILGVIFMPMIPFGLSVFLAIPIMYVSALLKKHSIVRLILFIVFLAGMFALYYYVLTILAKFFIDNKLSQNGTLDIWRSVVGGLDKYYNPAFYLSCIIFFKKFGLGFGVLLGASVVLIGGGVAVAKLVYEKIRSKQLEGVSSVFKKNSHIDGLGAGQAMFRHTFLEILHTKTYSFFYLGVAIATPVMVFFCNRLTSMVGEATIGAGIEFGCAVLVLSVLMAMIGSFSASVLNMEGKNFYITKMIPVSYRKQLLVKGVVNIVVSLGALLVSLIVLIAVKFLGAVDMVVLSISQILFVVGLVFNGININLANPNLKPKANGEPEEINISFMLMIGLFISALFGLCSLILPKLLANGSTWAYLIDVGVALVYALTNFLVFWFTANKKYRKIGV